MVESKRNAADIPGPAGRILRGPTLNEYSVRVVENYEKENVSGGW